MILAINVLAKLDQDNSQSMSFVFSYFNFLKILSIKCEPGVAFVLNDFLTLSVTSVERTVKRLG